MKNKYPLAKDKIIKSLFQRELNFTEILKETKLSKPIVAECLKELEEQSRIEKADKYKKYSRYRKYKLINNKDYTFLRNELTSFALYYIYYIAIAKLNETSLSKNSTIKENGYHINSIAFEKHLKDIYLPELVKWLGELVLFSIYSKTNRKTALDALNLLTLSLEDMVPEYEKTFEIDLVNDYFYKRYHTKFKDLENNIENINLKNALEFFTTMVEADMMVYNSCNNRKEKLEFWEHNEKKYQKLGFPFINFYQSMIKKMKNSKYQT